MRKIRVLPAALSLAMLLQTSAFAASFTDVSESQYKWAYSSIEQFVERGVVQGNGDGTFAPDNNVTREEFSKMLALTFGKTPLQTETPSFSDVSTNAWSFEYVEAVKDYLPGYTDAASGTTAFRPTVAATREDVASAIVRLLGYPVDDADSDTAKKQFSDFSQISAGLQSYVGAAAKYQLLLGYEDGTIRPQANVTRAEAVVMLDRALTLLEQDAPSIALSNCPTSVKESTVKLEGTVTDLQDGAPTLTINGKRAALSSTGAFSETLTLTRGDNTVTFVATNKNGKTRTVSRTITYSVEATEGQFWGYIVKDPETVRISGSTYTAFTVWDGEKNFTLSLEGKVTSLAKGSVVKYNMFMDGSVYADPVVGITDAVIDIYKDEITFASDSSKSYKIDDDTIILYVDTQNECGVTGGAIQVAEELANGSFKNNVFYTLNGNKVKILVVDTQNEWAPN